MKVTYENHMGTDLSVVNAAKVSFGKRSVFEGRVGGPDVLSKQDQSLIAFLARGCTSGDWDNLIHRCSEAHENYDEGALYEIERVLKHVKSMPSHWSPFSHTAVTLHLKMPIFVARQIMKHTTGIEYNEISRRYVDSEPEFYVPDVWRKKADDVKQGSSNEAVDLTSGDIWYDPYEGSVNALRAFGIVSEGVRSLYELLLEQGVAPEQARMVLPQSMYTEVIATGNLYAWANMYIQRTDRHAQKETQDLAKQIGEIIQPLYPVSWEALTKGEVII